MTDREMELITISELSKELGINKSKINYYYSVGLLEKTTTLSGMHVFDKKKTKKILKKIKSLQAEGNNLQKIKKML